MYQPWNQESSLEKSEWVWEKINPQIHGKNLKMIQFFVNFSKSFYSI